MIEKILLKLLGIPSIEQFLQLKAEELFKDTKEFIKAVEEAKLTNEQWFIDWEIEMNKLTVKDHNSQS